MSNFFPTNIELTEDQKAVLTATGNLVVEGPAGTGKTLLAILLAEKIHEEGKGEKTTAIVIFTKALKRFISAAIHSRGIINCRVYYYNEWLEIDSRFDYIIIDEAQDFSIEQILQILGAAEKGFYIFGDTKQSIFDFHRTASLREIADELGLDLFHLTTNVRFNEGIKAFVTNAFPDVQIETSTGTDIIKPKIILCNSYQEEMETIRRLLQDRNLPGSTAILLYRNKSTTWMNTTTYGILEVHKALADWGIEDSGYKTEWEEKLCFPEFGDSANVLTYHSSKGLEFDNIIMPFFDVVNQVQDEDKYVYYVGLTRARKQVIITYTESFNPRLENLETTFYDGRIMRPYNLEKAETLLAMEFVIIKEKCRIAKEYDFLYDAAHDEKEIKKAIEQAKLLLVEGGYSEVELNELITRVRHQYLND